MNFAKTLCGLNNNGQGNEDSQSSAEGKQPQDNTMALVYPDGRVTNVKVRPKKSYS
ncbi:hypothetical protein IQ260_00275 [Leptolyngbya cf. ectocarpi LEGE 11479]|uniref:Uncharacterized protein n=1 Tax=Leptolyngbya cf. ectocarpi LEGE 11479 TaxID=1828722 RepID=A0A928WZE0_LEPEC|nr:hypothetical protein [Leptolyngbya ectocarpi]MBE9065090.1 hypothetical protein [Leptolyngbya cf. ectocarpi LEGE 11479]